MAGYEYNSDEYSDSRLDTRPKGVQYSVVTDLVSEPVTDTFFKQHARIDFDTDDDLVEVYLKAARQHLEQWSQLSFGEKTIIITAERLPKMYKLMHGKVDSIVTSGFSNIGDFLVEGGTDIAVQYTTKDTVEDVIKIAICRYAAGLYMFRENIVDTKLNATTVMDKAKEMLQPYRNISLW